MIYLKEFNDHQSYESYINGNNVILPNVSICKGTNDVHYNPKIPVEGDIQIFADQECTRYATGSEQTVYARVNIPWGFDNYWRVGTSGNAGTNLIASGPNSEYPNDPYVIWVWIDWLSDDFTTPFTVGQVIECTCVPGEFVPVSNPTVIFRKP